MYFLCSWWYNVDRKESDKQLMLPGNKVGTFLVREAAGVFLFTHFPPKLLLTSSLKYCQEYTDTCKSIDLKQYVIL